jgi:signal transduction histidine kinase
MLPPADPPAEAILRLARRFVNSLAGRIIFLLLGFLVLAELLAFLPTMGAYQRTWLEERVNAAQIAALAVEAAPPQAEIAKGLKRELLENAGVRVVALKRGQERVLRLDEGVPANAPLRVIDLRTRGFLPDVTSAIATLFAPKGLLLQVRATPRFETGEFIEIVFPARALREDLRERARRVVGETLFLFLSVGGLLFVALFYLFVRPMRRVTKAVEAFRDRPEDASIAIRPSNRKDEIGRAEQALATMEHSVRNALRQQGRLAALGAAVAKIAHDLRASLATAQLVTERLAASADPTVRQAAPRLERAISRAAALAESALRYGKADEPEPDLRPLNVQSALSEAADDALFGFADVAFINQVPGALMSAADAELVHRILVNLIRNAAQAMAGRPDARITGNAHAGEGGKVQIYITDNGPGITDAVRQRLFEPFASGKRDGGAGLGLAIARELARAQGGDLALTANSAEGAVFRLTLRAEPPTD